MNRYQEENAAFKIDGYYNPPKNKADVSKAFESARALCLEQLRKTNAHVEEMTVEQFLRGRRSGSPTETPTETH